jgi:hypothetical protein
VTNYDFIIKLKDNRKWTTVRCFNEFVTKLFAMTESLEFVETGTDVYINTDTQLTMSLTMLNSKEFNICFKAPLDTEEEHLLIQLMINSIIAEDKYLVFKERVAHEKMIVGLLGLNDITIMQRERFNKIYVAICMYQDEISTVTAYRHFTNAVKVWEHFTGKNWEDFQENKDEIDYSEYSGSNIYEIEVE